MPKTAPPNTHANATKLVVIELMIVPGSCVIVGILHLGDTNGAGKAVPSGAVAQEVIHVEFCVVYGCNNGMSVEAVVHRKVLIDMREYAGSLDVRRIEFWMTRIVLG
jgi:hypothetical protein